MAAFICSYVLSFSLSFLFFGVVSAQLSPSYYDNSCPEALSIIKSVVFSAVANQNRMGASLLRLHFHDCFVLGCDASVLLDDTSTFTGEKNAKPNKNSLRGFDVVDTIKSRLESACPQTVSCADILAVAARDSVVALGGPWWTVPLGRRDSTTASLSEANRDLPPPTANLSALKTFFWNKGLSTTDMVALSGAHTIGLARCVTFRSRIYNDTNINPNFARAKQSNCPSSGGNNNLAPLDVCTPYIFDSYYFRNLLWQKGLLHSDQALYNGGSTDSLVSHYSRNTAAFFSDFWTAMVNMGNINVSIRPQGEVRINCRVIN